MSVQYRKFQVNPLLKYSQINVLILLEIADDYHVPEEQKSGDWLNEMLS